MPSAPKLKITSVNYSVKQGKIDPSYQSMTLMEPVLVITNLPDKNGAVVLANTLIEQRLAACVNVLNPSTSVYRWQDKIESTEEIPVLIKTQRQHYERVEHLIKMMHPYELPEVIMVPIMGGLPAYLQWIAIETSLSD